VGNERRHYPCRNEVAEKNRTPGILSLGALFVDTTSRIVWSKRCKSVQGYSGGEGEMTGTPQTMPTDFCELCEEGNKKLLQEARLNAIDECLAIAYDYCDGACLDRGEFDEMVKLKEKIKSV
jgi:hypothetical protein